MHLYSDYLDIIEFIFKQNNLFDLLDLKAIKNKDILFDSKKLFAQ